MQTLLSLARSGDIAELKRRLELKTLASHATCVSGQRLSTREQLRDEALWYLRHDDLSEAIYRLEQAVS